MRRFILCCLCALFSYNAALQAQPTNEQWRHQRQEWTLPRPETTVFAVENLWGDIRVRTHAEDEIYVLANIQRHTDDPRAMSLVIDNESEQPGVQAHFPDPPTITAHADWQPRRIDLTVFVPANQALNLITDKGLAEARGLKAPVQVKTYTGDVYLRTHNAVNAHSDYGDIHTLFLTTDWAQHSRIKTLTGNIEVSFPHGGAAQVALQTKGQITTDYTVEIERDRHQELKTGKAQIGRKGKELTLHSERGAIKLLSSVIPEE